jgi:hypothetical protein
VRPGASPRIGLVDAVAARAAAARAGLVPLFGQRGALNFGGRQWKFRAMLVLSLMKAHMINIGAGTLGADVPTSCTPPFS